MVQDIYRQTQIGAHLQRRGSYYGETVYLKEIRGNLREDIGQVEAEVDSSIFLILRNDGRYIELGEAKKLAISRPSYHRMLDFSCCPLLRLLTVSGKIGDCECYKSGRLH